MDKIKTIFAIMILLFYYSQIIFARSDSTKLFFDLIVRYRFEAWNGMNAKNYGDNSPDAIGSLDDKLIYQRIIAGLRYKPTNVLTISAHLYDARAFGWSLSNNKYPDLFKIKDNAPQESFYIMNPQEEFFEIYDLNVEYQEIIENITLKFGRQKISYGDYRVFGPGEWGNTGRWTWDAFKIAYRQKKNFIDLFVGGTKTHNPNKLSIPFTDTEFFGGGIYSHFEINDYLIVEPFYSLKVQGSADYIKMQKINRNWLGVRIFNENINDFIYDFTFVKQFGRERAKRILAYGWVGKIGYKFDFLPAKPILSIRETYASGGKKSDETIKTFEPAFGASDRYYGWMNVASWTNLDDREIILELFPKENLWIEIKQNWFYIPEPTDFKFLNARQIQDGKNHLGDEFNIHARYQFSENWQFIVAFGYFWAGDLKPINNESVKNASWFAFQVLYTLN